MINYKHIAAVNKFQKFEKNQFFLLSRNRRCTNPKNSGIPSMSTFKTGNELKRKYIKTVRGSNDDDMDVDEEDLDEDQLDFEEECEPDEKKPETTVCNRFEPIAPIGPDRPNMSYRFVKI
jgi:hypothetical protein